jgi:bifunctional non-homologous end joining protein LigD
MDEIAASDSTWSSDAGGEKSKTVAAGEAVATLKPVSAKPAASAPVLAAKEKFPGFTEPMLATLTDGPFTRENWIFELKLDGYRIIGTKNKNETIIYSRRGNNYSDKYTSIVKELSSVNADFVIDGEVCFLEKNMSNFQKLQNFDKRQENLHYYVFDILWLNGHDLKRLTLTERKKLLKVLLSKSPEHIHYLDHIEKEGNAFFEKIRQEGHEGVLAKKADSRYLPGIRTKDWLKMKTGFRQEMIICGFVPSDKQSRVFSSLVCCVYEGDFLIYTGRVGSGFTESILKSLMKKLEKIKVQGPPVANPPPEKNIVWVEPVLTCEVRFSSWTDERIMRHPVFLGLREDKDPDEVSIEKPVSRLAAVSRVEFSNPGKVFWPDEGLTKKDVIDYYRDVSSVILPYLVDRPQSLYRTPNGIASKGFFQKNMKEIAPDWVKTITIESESRGEIEYMLCQDEDSLLYMANLGCIEINPWSSSLPDLDNPDYMIFDLDPVEIDFRELVKIAVEFRKLFEKLELPAYCKTSGSRGMHIYIPVRREYSYEQVQNFVKILESHIHNRFPSVTSFERSPSQRKGKIYLDYLQNGKGKTMASVYSLRPRPGALVSTPVGWDELTPSLKPENFTLINMRKRLEKKGDLWAGMFNKRIDMKEVLKNLKL